MREYEPSKLLDNMSLNDIQKYNGKNVEIQSLLEVFLNPKTLLLAFKIPSSLASAQYNLRILLNSRDVKLKSVKKKNLLIGLFLYEKMFNIKISIELLNLVNSSGFFLIFDDFTHFFYFEKFLMFKLFSNKIFPTYLKINNQYFFLKAEIFKQLCLKMFTFKNDHLLINGFFLFLFKFNLFLITFVLYFYFQKIILLNSF